MAAMTDKEEKKKKEQRKREDEEEDEDEDEAEEEEEEGDGDGEEEEEDDDADDDDLDLEEGVEQEGKKRSPGAASVGADEGIGKEKRRGRCKWFNVAKGWGFISPDDGGQDIFVHQSVVQMSGFRSLGDDEEVEFECKVSDKGLEATMVTGPDGTDCQGSHRRPAAKKRFRKISSRCYNCGEFANHIAAKCTMGPQPKRCHHCKSEDHLIADCPTRKEKKDTKDDGSDKGDVDEKKEEKSDEIKKEIKKEDQKEEKKDEKKDEKKGKGKKVEEKDVKAAVPAAQPAAS